MLLYHILFKFAANKFNCLTKTHLSYDKFLHENLTSVSSVSFRGGYAQGAEDVTSKLTDAAITAESNWGGGNSSSGNHSRNDNGYWESYHNTFNLTQTISGLEAGYYQVSIQAASSTATSTFSLTATSGDNAATPAYIKNRTHSSFSDMAAWWKADATQDLNRIYATVKVEEGQTLTVGVSQTATTDWVVYGQFKLSKLTDTEGENAIALEKVTNPLTAWTVTGNTGQYKDRLERYNEAMYTGDVIAYTVSNVPNGKYTVELNGAVSYTSGRGFDGKTGDNLTAAFVNSSQENVTVVDRTGVNNDAFSTFTVTGTVTDGTLKTGLTNVAEGGNWFVLSLNKITYLGEDLSDYQEPFETALKNAQAVNQESPMKATVLTALTTALTNYNKDFSSFTTLLQLYLL